MSLTSLIFSSWNSLIFFFFLSTSNWYQNRTHSINEAKSCIIYHKNIKACLSQSILVTCLGKLIYLKSDSHFSEKLFYLLQWKPFIMNKKAFYFILKALFVLKKNGLISKPAWQTVTIHLLPYILRSKGNQTKALCEVKASKWSAS